MPSARSPQSIPVLFEGLVDDAAVFPPGNAPLDVAAARHDEHRDAWYSPTIGPLLVPTASVDDLIALTADRPSPLPIGLVARPGVPVVQVAAAVSKALQHSGIRVASVELGWDPEWRDLPFTDLPIVLELPRGADQGAALLDLHEAVRGGEQVRGKFRTGATATWAWPDEAELAGVLDRATSLGVPLKLTGGLHHAVRGAYSETEGGAPTEQHGILNVLAAVHSLATGNGREHAAGLLAIREATDLADLVSAWDDEAVTITRTWLTGYGCCEVTDPVTELTVLDLLTKDGS